MTRRCFFVRGIESDTGTVCLPPQASHHLERVLRLKAGEMIEIRDGTGNAWDGKIAEIEKGRVTVRLVGRRECTALESHLAITLALGLARTDIMDLVVRQATELGVSRLIAFRAARSQYGLAGDRAAKKRDRWLQIGREAMCQCGRTKMPEIRVVSDLEELLSSLLPDDGSAGNLLKIFARERELDKSLGNLKILRPVCARVLAAVGPEGGWENAEIVRLSDAGFAPVHLGPRILRYETAVVALISSMQLLWGDMGEDMVKEGDEDEVR